MNIKVEDILTRLTAGESVDEIVEKFNSVLNDAIRLDEENKKAAEAAKKAEELKEKKREATKAFVNAIIDILDIYGYKEFVDIKTDDVDEWVEALDETFGQIDLIKGLIPKTVSKPLDGNFELNKYLKSVKKEDPVIKFLKDFDLA